jgi:hypothetical protein
VPRSISKRDSGTTVTSRYSSRILVVLLVGHPRLHFNDLCCGLKTVEGMRHNVSNPHRKCHLICGQNLNSVTAIVQSNDAGL